MVPQPCGIMKFSKKFVILENFVAIAEKFIWNPMSFNEQYSLYNLISAITKSEKIPNYSLLGKYWKPVTNSFPRES